MKKEKTVKTYQRRTKTGKVVTVRQHTAKYDASDPKTKVKGKSGSGEEFKALQDKWNNLISNMSDEELDASLSDSGVYDIFDAYWGDETPKELKAYPALTKYANSREWGKVAKMSPKVRGEIGRLMEKNGLGLDEEFYNTFPGTTKEQKKKLESLGLKRKNNIWSTSNGNYRLYTQKGISDFLNKFGHLNAEEISSLPKSKLVSKRAGVPYDAKGVEEVLNRAKERMSKGSTAEDAPVNRNSLVPRRRGYGDRWRRKNRI